MAKFRTAATALTKTLEKTSALVYLVGDDGTLQFANPACAAWTGVSQESLFGSRLNYCSEPSSVTTTDALQGLCPPPEVFGDSLTENETAIAFNIWTSHADADNEPTQAIYRTAHAFRLDDPDEDSFSILVISSNDDLTELPTDHSGSMLAKRLHVALAQIRQQAELTYRLESLVGVSPFAERLRRSVKMAANSRADVLIVGPPGSGKEHLARTIHAAGPSKGKSDLVPIQCALADPDLIQTVIKELLKQSKADRTRDKMPDAPSLLLLNIDQLSPIAQHELWNFLLLPNFPVRLIATSELKLIDLASGFDSNLAAALGTMTIELLPLCERAEDIPMLTQAILEKRNPKRERQLAGFDSVTLGLLTEYQWPGNLDQLSAIIRESAALTVTKMLTPDDLPKKFHDALLAQRIGGPVETTIDLLAYLESIERELLARAMQQAKGNKTKAAELLSVNRAKLLRRLAYFSLNETNADASDQAIDDTESPDFTETDGDDLE